MKYTGMLLLATVVSCHAALGQEPPQRNLHTVSIECSMSYVDRDTSQSGDLTLTPGKGTVNVRLEGPGLYIADTSLTIQLNPSATIWVSIPDVPTECHVRVSAVASQTGTSVSTEAGDCDAEIRMYVDEYLAGVDFADGAVFASAGCDAYVAAIPPGVPPKITLRLSNRAAR